MVSRVSFDSVLIALILAVFVVRLWCHERRRQAALSTDERIENITEKVRNPVRYRVSTTLRWIVG